MPIFQLQNQHLNSEKWDVGHLSAFGWAVLLRLNFNEESKH